MGRISWELRVLAFAFLWLWLPENGWATKREDLERAAELAVERAAERAAERAVEKALESGNSTSETETIRESYSSVRKSDKTIQLPGSGYTPAQRHEYDRIMREREAGERASAVLKRSVDNRGGDALQQIEVGKSDQRSSEDKQQLQQPGKNLPETVSPTVGSFYVTKQLPFPVGGYHSPDATAGDDQQQQHDHHQHQQQQQEQHQQRLPPVYTFRDGDQFPSVYPVKVIAIQTTKPYPLKLFRVMPSSVALVPVATSTSIDSYPHSIDREAQRVASTDDHSTANKDERRPGQGWIYR